MGGRFRLNSGLLSLLLCMVVLLMLWTYHGGSDNEWVDDSEHHNKLIMRPTRKSVAPMNLGCEKTIFEYKMEDPCLLEQIQRWLLGQMLPAEGHQFDKIPPKLDGQVGAPLIVDEILGRLERGFYIECGAHDGEYLSNSLFFEVRRNWTGLLIEPDTKTFPRLMLKNRNAFHINTCISGSLKAQLVNFQSEQELSKVIGETNGPNGIGKSAQKGAQVICLPLYSLLLAVGNPIVDFFSLDVEGSEIEVLRSIPWERVKIRVILVEVNHVDKSVVNTILTDAGYCLYDQTYEVGQMDHTLDFVYAHSQYTNVCSHPKIKNPFL